MKNFTLLISLLLLNLAVSRHAFSAVTDCGCSDATNALKNGSFEAGTDNWSKTDGTNFGTDNAYDVCGEKNGLITGAGTIYQDVTLVAGSIVDLTVYGGTHDLTKTHLFKLTFYNSSGQKIDGDHNVSVDMNYKVTDNHDLKQFSLSSTAPAGATKVRFAATSSGDYFKIDVACMSVTPPAPTDCGCPDATNALKNGSFESGTGEWSKSTNTNFSTDTKYSQCGAKNGLIDGSGSIYQEINLTPGSTVDLTVYGGTHDISFSHKFKLDFYNSSGQIITSPNNNKSVDMNYKVTEYHKLQKYTLAATAPAGAVKVRFSATSNGNYFKIDVGCMTVNLAPPVDCGCKDADNALKNGSFESGTDNWLKSPNTNFSSDEAYSICGTKNGLITGAGSIYQEVNLVQGSKVNLTVYGGTHDISKTHKFKLEFYNASGVLVPIPEDNNNTVEMDYKVTETHKLQQYSLSGTAPLGATKVRITASSTGDYFKVDVVCMTITSPPPVTCEECTGNKIVNGSFESGTDNWSTTGNVFADQIIANCGLKSLILAGAGSFTQDITILSTFGSTINVNFWGAVKTDRDQKLEIIFLDGSNKVLGTLTQQIDKLVESDPWGLKKYTLSGVIPSGTSTARIKGSGSEDYLAVDGFCVTFSGSPLPVTLISFDAKKEGSTATLTWSTSFETNSDHFDIQHSQDGKAWSNLATIQAQGESKVVVPYHYTHTSPFNNNLYRLKMVDLDGTFAYSSIKSLNFNGEEQMNIYPNPTADRIKLSSNMQIANVKIYSQTGVMVMNTRPDSGNEVDLTKLAQGTYFVKINDGTLTRKILIVR
jgi:hypothetical protein